jgi:hypothetical protein
MAIPELIVYMRKMRGRWDISPKSYAKIRRWAARYDVKAPQITPRPYPNNNGRQKRMVVEPTPGML